ncbi:MAG: tetratricopeptide repeat protein, partial [Candidatus Gastranaerophilales bacterium]|nr:tetratricopeptide repeat protein [Candidatus Gastranaerophilales bacterium]
MKKKLVLIITVMILILNIQSSFAMNQEAYEYYQKSTAYHRINNYDEAISYLKKAISLSPDDPLLHTKLAGLYTEKGMWEQALVEYNQVINLKPNDAFVYVSIGNILQQ